MRLDLVIDAGAALSALEAQIQATSQPFGSGVGARVLGRMRAAFREEFERGAERTASGFRKWKPTHPWGTRPATAPPLGGASGRVAQAWAGGKGGFSSIKGTEITVGVRAPWAAVHRGDNGAFTVIRPRVGQKMRFLHGLKFGIWISQRRLQEGLKVPARPHATANAGLALIIRDALLGLK